MKKTIFLISLAFAPHLKPVKGKALIRAAGEGHELAKTLRKRESIQYVRTTLLLKLNRALEAKITCYEKAQSENLFIEIRDLQERIQKLKEQIRANNTESSKLSTAIPTQLPPSIRGQLLEITTQIGSRSFTE